MNSCSSAPCPGLCVQWISIVLFLVKYSFKNNDFMEKKKQKHPNLLPSPLLPPSSPSPLPLAWHELNLFSTLIQIRPLLLQDAPADVKLWKQKKNKRQQQRCSRRTHSCLLASDSRSNQTFVFVLLLPSDYLTHVDFCIFGYLDCKQQAPLRVKIARQR